VNRLEEFRAAMHAAGAHSEIPSLQAILHRESVLQWRWAAAAMAAVALVAVPIYQDAQQRAQEQADALLMEKVNAALARSVPRALSPLMGN
jgi:anti-sigma-K factor RskA